MSTPAPGPLHRETMRVEARHTVPAIAPDWPGFADMPPVLATAIMVGFMEQTCITALRPYLQAGQHTVGTRVDMSHVAATPVGMRITAEVELTSVQGRTLTFRVSCHDDAGLIGEGIHNRAIIDVERFLARVASKQGEAAT
ncbi:thioesterase family protein [Paracoccus sp. CPCC 101403]|uniref:Thioesterase family protein n=1 Tax=Paracoccus broussonetiae TaxID=3075834 RepID=A0ABU3ECH4_9RHOB|nr:thioesterase family protein [Paracoccus sp. CPCC 101403]MDT1061931.1 thioesterase family protein [Paracoccus sp. CPCC 101403]